MIGSPVNARRSTSNVERLMENPPFSHSYSRKMKIILVAIRLCITKCIGCFLLFFCSASANATMPTTVLQGYSYEELVLVKIGTFGKKRMACFATNDGTVVWGGRLYRLGKGRGFITKVGKGFLLIEDTILLNGEDWVARVFRWPVSTAKNELARKCGMPFAESTSGM
jgi:hypothetical protein